jgi:hypothetical protein
MPAEPFVTRILSCSIPAKALNAEPEAARHREQ